MPRNPALGGVVRGPAKAANPIACLAFVVFLAVAFWAGALWIGEMLLNVTSQPI